MFTYRPTDDFPDLVDFGPLSNLNAVSLEGNAEQFGRADFGDPTMNIVVGVWRCTRGKVKMTYPFNKGFTVLTGELTLQKEN